MNRNKKLFNPQKVFIIILGLSLLSVIIFLCYRNNKITKEIKELNNLIDRNNNLIDRNISSVRTQIGTEIDVAKAEINKPIDQLMAVILNMVRVFP